MIEAKHNKAARFIFNIYANRLLKRSFQSFNLVNKPPEIPTDKGLIITPNHFSWWDGFFSDYICSKILRRKFHIMMLEHQLERYWFFKYVGAYSINQSNPKSISNTFNYTVSKVKDSNNVIILYPQGAIEPYDGYPFSLKKGIQYLIKKIDNKIIILPAAFKIDFNEDKKPFVYCRFGNPIESNVIKDNFNFYENEFNFNLAELDKATKLKASYIDLFNRRSII